MTTTIKTAIIAGLIALAGTMAAPASAEAGQTLISCQKINQYPGGHVSAHGRAPRLCPIFTPDMSFAEAAYLARINWRSWGGRVAGFRAISVGFKRPRTLTPVRGFAFRRRPNRCGGEVQVYTRVLIATHRGRRVVRPHDCLAVD